ncbi:MAG TPA: hypothetical protein VJM50_22200, partial [Pyrinomonadaceae bacterium]|nr:hypothetical protein [Pyrinomonadaceae bacterium]
MAAFTTPPLDTFPESDELGRTPSPITFEMICAFVERRIVFISPATPLTTGAAADVPVTFKYPPPIRVVRMFTPGAATL